LIGLKIENSWNLKKIIQKKADLRVQNVEWKTQVSDLKQYSLKDASSV
jgi:hypothetical protein